MKKIMLITVMLILIALPFFSGCITYDYGLISVTGVKGDIVYVEYPENWEYASSFSATVQVKNVGSSAGYLYVFHIDKKFIGPPCRNCDSLFRTANILSPGQIETVTVTWNLPTGYTSLGKDYEGFIAVSHDDGTGGCSSCSLNDDVFEFIMYYGPYKTEPSNAKGEIISVDYPENWEHASSFSATVQVKNVGSSAGYLYVFHIDKKFIGPPCRNCDSLFRTANILSPGQIKTVTVTWNLPTGYTSLGKDYEGFIAVSHDDGTGGCSSCSLNDDVYEFIMTYGTSNVDYNVEIFTKDQDGKIIPECSVTINTIEGTIVETFITDTNGKCTLRLPKGEYSVIATKSGYTSESSLMEINQDSSFTIVLYTPDWKPYVPPKNKDIPGFELLLMFLAFIIIIIRNKTWGLKK